MRAPDSESGGTRKVLTAGQETVGQRLDQWLAAALAPEISRNRVQILIREGLVEVAGRIVREPKHRLSGGEDVVLELPEAEPPEPEAEAIPLKILYEDEHLIVIDKPAGLVVHPGAGNPTGTLVNALLHHCGDTLSGIGGVKRPGIVHRLDKDTSGVMVAAKNDAAHRTLSAAFADHGQEGDLQRAYLALVWGEPEPASGQVDAPLGRAGPDRTLRAVVPEGRPDARHAVTHYRVLERFGPSRPAPVSLVECRLETGRTHQIRVHMTHMGHPIVGDPVYGRATRARMARLGSEAQNAVRGFPRQALHAAVLGFLHPVTGAALRFERPPPDDMAALIVALGRETDRQEGIETSR
jgi:23S rRNA pseudouridine1911/1915/1917 synthase